MTGGGTLVVAVVTRSAKYYLLGYTEWRRGKGTAADGLLIDYTTAAAGSGGTTGGILMVVLLLLLLVVVLLLVGPAAEDWLPTYRLQRVEAACWCRSQHSCQSCTPAPSGACTGGPTARASPGDAQDEVPGSSTQHTCSQVMISSGGAAASPQGPGVTTFLLSTDCNDRPQSKDLSLTA